MENVFVLDSVVNVCFVMIAIVGFMLCVFIVAGCISASMQASSFYVYHKYKKLAHEYIANSTDCNKFGELISGQLGYIELTFQAYLAVSSMCEKIIVLGLKNSNFYAVSTLNRDEFINIKLRPIAVILTLNKKQSVVVMKTKDDYKEFCAYIKQLKKSTIESVLQKDLDERTKKKLQLESATNAESLAFCSEVHTQAKRELAEAELELDGVAKNLSEQYGVHL